MKLGSIGEMPPSTIGRSGFIVRMDFAARIAISANIFQSGSILKSQCDRLLGSFHSITASTMYQCPQLACRMPTDSFTEFLPTPNLECTCHPAVRFSARRSKSRPRDVRLAQAQSCAGYPPQPRDLE